MSVNLIELTRRAISPSILERVGHGLSADIETVSVAIDRASSVVLCKMMQISTTERGWKTLETALLPHEDGLLEESAVESDDAWSQAFGRRGGETVESIFGASTPDAIAGMVESTEFDSQQATLLLQLVAPTVCSVLGRQQQVRRLDRQGIGDLLAQQHVHVAEALPAALSDWMPHVHAAQATSLLPEDDPFESESRSLPSVGQSLIAKLFPLIVLFVVGLTLLLYLGQRSQRSVSPSSTADSNVVASRSDDMGLPGHVLMPTSSGLTGLDGFKDLFAELDATLQGIQDEAEATHALPQLFELNDKLNRLADSTEHLPRQIHDEIRRATLEFLPQLDDRLGVLYSADGVQDILSPLLNRMARTLRQSASGDVTDS